MNKTISETSMAHGGQLGATPAGAEWCLKALHPAAELTIKSGIPDLMPQPAVVQKFDLTYVIANPNPGAGLNWTASMMFYANPWCLGCAQTYDGATLAYVPMFNTVMGTSTGYGLAIRQAIHDGVEAYRLIFGSATCILDATATTDSGTVVAGSYIYEPHDCSVDQISTIKTYNRPAQLWCDTPKNYDVLAMMPGAYVGAARDGVYAPYKLDPQFPWKRTNNYVCHANNGDTSALAYNEVMKDMPGAGTTAPNWPYGIAGCDRTPSYQVIPQNCGRNASQVYFRNLNPIATIRVTLHYAFEFLVPPSVSYASFLRMPSDPDPLAIQMYTVISQRLKDGYPASYNDLGDILRKIWGVAKVVAPMISPFFGGAVHVVDGLANILAKKRDAQGNVIPKPVKAPKAPKARPPALAKKKNGKK
jgi:hypothetical protein